MAPQPSQAGASIWNWANCSLRMLGLAGSVLVMTPARSSSLALSWAAVEAVDLSASLAWLKRTTDGPDLAFAPLPLPLECPLPLPFVWPLAPLAPLALADGAVVCS